MLSHNMHIAAIRFIEKYNEPIQSVDLNCLLSEIGQPYLVRSTWLDWELAFQEVLVALGKFKKTDFKVQRDWLEDILPEVIQISSAEIYAIIIRFLENYNCSLQSTDINNLI